LTAVELGKRMGATVIASARGAEKCALAASHGADHVLDSGTEDLKTRVREITKNRGVDMVYDPVGGDAFDVAVRLLAWEGRLMVVGFAAGRIPQAPANILLVKNAAVIGVLWGAYRNLAPGIVRASFEELLGWYSAGQLKPHISLRLPLARVEDGFAAMLARRSTGKIVFDIG
jgi:NADPH2:quinone reductase